MLCMRLLAVIILFTNLFYRSQATHQHGCLIEPRLCPPTQFCVDDGYTGDCVENRLTRDGYQLTQPRTDGKKEETLASLLRPSTYQHLMTLVHGVKSYLRSKNLDFSDLTNSEVDHLASGMARAFIKQEETTKKSKINHLMGLVLTVKKELAKRGIDINQLGDKEVEILLDAITQQYMKDEGLKQETGIKDPPQKDKLNSPKAIPDTDPDARTPPTNIFMQFPVVDDTSVDGGGSMDENLSVDPPLGLKSNQKKIDPVPAPPSGQSEASIDKRIPGDGASNKNEVSSSKDDSERIGANGLPAHNVVTTGSTKAAASKEETPYIVIIAVVLAVLVCLVVIAVVIYCMKAAAFREKLVGIPSDVSDDDYQDLCRQHYASKANEDDMKEPLLAKEKVVPSTRVFSPISSRRRHETSRNSSVSSWSEEPITSSLDISTGHAVLAYMEDHLLNKDRLEKEWRALCTYQADKADMTVAKSNNPGNRFPNAVPYDHNRVRLNALSSPMNNDYINASFIIDNDPRWPLYIATQGPLSSTVHHFWQMVWEQGCVAIVMLTALTEEGVAQCARYWPDEGSSTYNNYEIHLVSEHIWCDDYLIRSLYLKNLESCETRTVTQFHFLSWPLNGIPSSQKPLLELRRKVSKCHRGNGFSPILVHCNDGCGRTGSYVLLDLVINRMIKGTCKEIDIAATLEHLRDQRAGMVASKKQFQFSLSCVAEEVNAILRSLPR